MNEKEFGQKLRPWLQRSADQVGELQATRLRAARLNAMENWREPVSLLGLIQVSSGTVQALRYTFLQRALLVLPVAALLAALALQSVTSEGDFGDLDAALLTQELPPDAYLDQDFRSWLHKSTRG